MITEDTLLLYFYDELSPEERSEIDAAFARDPALKARYQALCAMLADWRNATHTPASDMQKRRWHDSIDRMAQPITGQRQVRRTGPRVWLLGFAAALTTALVAGVFIGTKLVDESTPSIAPDFAIAGPDALSPRTVPASFTRGLQVYLQDSRAEISRLALDNYADRTMLTMQLIQQNRLFERAATQSNAPNLARVLRAFEPILLRLASEDIAPQDMEDLRKQLAFELRVVLTKLENAPSEVAQTI